MRKAEPGSKPYSLDLTSFASLGLRCGHGATVCTTDRVFSRFSGLKWTNPLAEIR